LVSTGASLLPLPLGGEAALGGLAAFLGESFLPAFLSETLEALLLRFLAGETSALAGAFLAAGSGLGSGCLALEAALSAFLGG
jgi:hypothetical protein